MRKQVKKGHYDFNKYLSIGRWNSYYYQIEEVAKCKGKDVLLIGVGDGIVANILEKTGKKVITFDFDKSLNPDIVGDVTKIDEIVTKKYDVVICCQVLEHIPFDMFEETIQKISKIVKEKFVLSLPNHNIWAKLNIKLPCIKEKNIKLHMRKFWKNNFDINKEGLGEHYWEIDATKKYKLRKIKKLLNENFEIENFFIPKDNTYHMFFILKRR